MNILFISLFFNRFMSIGGWSILNRWLVEAKKNENFPVLVELLEVTKDYKHFPALNCIVWYYVIDCM